MRKPLLPFALFALAAGLTASAQPPAAVPAVVVPATAAPAGWTATEAPEPRPVGGPGAGAAAPAGKEKAAGPAESPRMTRLKQLAFDRRPSAVLKAWAPPPGNDKPGPTKDPKEEALDRELTGFQKQVTLGDWPAVKTYLASLPDEEAAAAYRQLLKSLQQQPAMTPGGPEAAMMMQMMPAAQQFAERHAFAAADILGLAAAAPRGPNPALFPPRAAAAGATGVVAAAPAGLDKEHVAALAGLLREALAGATLPEVAVARLKAEVAKPAGEAVLTRRQAARLLTAAGHAEYAGDFLPSADEARKTADLEALNLLSRYFLALQTREAKTGNLEQAWAAVQAVLAVPGGSAEEKEEGLLRAVDLAPRLKDELGQAWLDASFTKDPERGMEILATAGGLVARGLSSRPHAPDDRLNALKLTKTAVEALLKAAPDRARGWRPTLTLLAAAWLREAEFSQQYDQSAGGGARLHRDMFGNIYFGGDDPGARMMMQQRPDMPRPVPVADVLKAAPTPAWVAAVDDAFRPKLAGTVARLHLKANEEDKAFPLIEALAPAQPVEARELVKEFLRVWTRNHDPNAARNENRYSWFFFAFEQRAEGIPLTRSKQERNLAELAGWAARIKKLPHGAGDLDDETTVKAFTACHSSAEVYRTEAIEAVFGPAGGLKPKTLAGLADQMRGNLAGLWKDPAEQQKKKTNRKKKDIEAEVLRGYAVARGVVDDGLKKFPGHWAVLAAKAGLMHDEVNYRQELNKSADFSRQRAAALAVYKQAAEGYAAAARGMPEADHTTSVYEEWFAAGLGAVDLGMITEDKQPDWAQPPLIRAAILALPGDLAEKHLARFANNLFIKMSGAKPHVKFNYLKAGFAIAGDHKQAAEAKKVFDYYKDLVTEIKLDAVVDGPARVGHGRAFGLFVNIRHTRDIERESGGFGRYLQNQTGMMFAYNYGRPTADYRDRFEAAARAALKEQFEVVSVTFQDEKVHSRAAAEFGWRYTPYAYILLKPRGPQVDKIPPLRIDLDFLDTSGFVVLPVESPAVPVDARDPAGDPRPVDKLAVTQILDERQADKGVLLLEVKAVGVGLVPELADLCAVAPDGFEVVKTEDQGLGVKKFEEDADQNGVVSERSWLLTLKGREGLPELPKTFRFGAVKVPAKEVVYQRYSDADLATVGEELLLDRVYGAKSTARVWWAVSGGVLGLVVLAAAFALVFRKKRPAPVRRELPADLDPFVAAALLREVRGRPGLTPAQLAALDQDLAAVEHFHFSGQSNGHPPPDLRQLVARWLDAVPG